MSAVMNAVYNNFLTTYTPSLTRYDTHKKSELRSIYNSIVKINKESPWYLPTTSKDTQRYAVDMKENARGLHNTIAQLDGLEENSGLLDKKSAFSTDMDIAEATYIGSRTSAGASPSFSLEVKSLASPQENLGYFLPDAKIDLPPDTYSFDIAVNDMNYEFQFSIGEDETNREVQDRLVRLINNSDIGIRASLVESEDQSSLRLVSEATGLPNGKEQLFHVSDNRTSKTSGTVNYFGLDYVSKEASNATFLVNDELREASVNHFTIGKLFDVKLKGVSPEGEPIQIGLKTDVESFTDNVTSLISGYNDFIKAASAYQETQLKSRKLVRELSGIAKLYNNSLNSTGLNLQKDGTLEVDRDQLLRTATQASDLSQTFGYLKDFSNALLRKSNQVSLNPMDYVDKVVVAYKNPGHNFVSPYATSAYSGMMFNGYC